MFPTVDGATKDLCVSSTLELLRENVAVCRSAEIHGGGQGFWRSSNVLGLVAVISGINWFRVRPRPHLVTSIKQLEST